MGFIIKKRGWGLGLFLVKWIIEEYYFGKIFVKKLVENEGIIFLIILLKGDEKLLVSVLIEVD